MVALPVWTCRKLRISGHTQSTHTRKMITELESHLIERAFVGPTYTTTSLLISQGHSRQGIDGRIQLKQESVIAAEDKTRRTHLYPLLYDGGGVKEILSSGRACYQMVGTRCYHSCPDHCSSLTGRGTNTPCSG